MKYKNWTPKQLSNALSINQEIKMPINGISINSKLINKGNLFIPLKGKKNDGHSFIEESFKKGANLSLVNKNSFNKFKLKKFKNKIILVNNILSSLHQLASFSRNEIKGKILGITGSVGKTSIKESISFLLKKDNKVQFSSGNFNNLIGMPINLANFKENLDFGILELGMNKKNEIKKLSKICRPDIGLITKITNAHIGNFKSLKEIALAKSEIFLGMKSSSLAIINNNDYFSPLIKKKAKESGIQNFISYGNSKDSNVRLIKYYYKKNSCQVTLDVFGKKFDYILNNLGDHWIENSLAIVSIFIALNKNLNIFRENIPKFQAIAGRGQIKNVNCNNIKFDLIDDSYNSSPESLKSSIFFLNRYGYKRRKICVLGDMLELGLFSKKLHLDMKKILKDNKISKVYTIGNKMKNLFNSLPISIQGIHSENIEELYLNLKKNIENNDIILFKGSRAMKLDKVINKFS